MRKFLGYILLIIASILLLLDPAKNYIIQKNQENNIISNFTREEIIQNQNQNVSYNFDDISPINSLDVILNSTNIDELPVIGGIAIPNLNLNLPIFLGVTDAAMYAGASTLKSNQTMGKENFAIASHHSIHEDLLFAPLVNIKYDDKIYLTDLENIYIYNTYYIETVPAERIDLIYDNGENIVTLITCSNDLINRIAVRGKLIEIKPLNQASQEELNYFNIEITIPN